MSRPINKFRCFPRDSGNSVGDDRGYVRPMVGGRAIPYDRYERSFVLPIHHNER